MPSQGVIARDLMPMDFKRRKLVPVIGIAEVARRLQEQCPARYPQPEFALFVCAQGQVVGFGGIALEEPGTELADIANAEECRVADELLIFVGVGRGRGHKFVFDRVEQIEGEFAKSLVAAVGQNRSFIERNDREERWADFTVAE